MVILKGLIYPAMFIASFFAFQWTLAAGVNGATALFLISAANLVIVAGLEIVLPYRRDWSWWRDGQSANDIVHSILLSLVGGRLAEVALRSGIVSASAAVASATGGSIWPGHLPLWGQVGIAVILIDFLDWGKHWLYHNNSFAWPFHALHHNADKLHVLKAGRLHFLESSIRFAVTIAPLIILGAGPEVFLWYGILINTEGNLNHSNVDMPLPGFLHYLLATPQVHRLHHELDPDLGRSNLSSATPLPDIIFGTYRHPHNHPLNAVGIVSNPIPNDLVSQLFSPFIWPILVWRQQRKADKQKSN